MAGSLVGSDIIFCVRSKPGLSRVPGGAVAFAVVVAGVVGVTAADMAELDGRSGLEGELSTGP
jgi:hypothetical protein